MSDTIAPTAALTVPCLAQMITEVAERALDPEKRMHQESDAVMYGKLTLLDSISTMVCTGGAVLTYEEEKLLNAAQKRLDAAWNAMADAVGAA